jgi:hypothetical protein
VYGLARSGLAQRPADPFSDGQALAASKPPDLLHIRIGHNNL